MNFASLCNCEGVGEQYEAQGQHVSFTIRAADVFCLSHVVDDPFQRFALQLSYLLVIWCDEMNARSRLRSVFHYNILGHGALHDEALMGHWVDELLDIGLLGHVDLAVVEFRNVGAVEVSSCW